MSKIFLFLSEFIKSKRRTFNSKDDLERWQREKLISHIKEIQEKSSFYKEYYKNYDIQDIKSLPTINKQMMMENFDDLITANISKEQAFDVALKSEESRNFSPTINDITVGLSSGTSGNRGLFLVSEEERIKWAAMILSKLLPKPLFQKHRIAFFLRANSNLYTTINKGVISFQFFDLMEDLSVNMSKLNDFQPTIIVAPASMLRFVAEEQSKQQINIQPKKIMSVAEVLEEIDKVFIEKTFNQVVHQVYQCTEGFLGYTCEHGHIHLNEDMVYIEKKYLDENRFIPIISDFYRTTQPIFKYELNDILMENKEECPCGSKFTRIEKIEGRSDDIFYFKKSDDTLKPLFADFIRRAIISSSDNIEEYKATQIDYNKIVIELKMKDKNKEEIQQRIINNINSFLSDVSEKPLIEFKDYSLQPSITKLRRVERKFQIA